MRIAETARPPPSELNALQDFAGVDGQSQRPPEGGIGERLAFEVDAHLDGIERIGRHQGQVGLL